MLHADVEQLAIRLDTSRRVRLTGIIAVEDVIGIDKAEALTSDISQIGPGEIILQSRCHFVDIVRLIEIERTHPVQVFFYLTQTEMLVVEPHLGQFGVERSQQRVGTIVNTHYINPHQGATLTIVFTDSPDDGIRLTVRSRNMP